MQSIHIYQEDAMPDTPAGFESVAYAADTAMVEAIAMNEDIDRYFADMDDEDNVALINELAA